MFPFDHYIWCGIHKEHRFTMWLCVTPSQVWLSSVYILMLFEWLGDPVITRLAHGALCGLYTFSFSKLHVICVHGTLWWPFVIYTFQSGNLVLYVDNNRFVKLNSQELVVRFLCVEALRLWARWRPFRITLLLTATSSTSVFHSWSPIFHSIEIGFLCSVYSTSPFCIGVLESDG